MNLKRTLLTLLLVLSGWAVAAAQTEVLPQPQQWQGVNLVWNPRSHDVVCHGKSAVPAGEDRRAMTVYDADGTQAQRTVKVLTYRCAVNHEEMVVYVEPDTNQVRDVTCHQGKVCANVGYDGKHHGQAMTCPEGHTFYLVGAKH